MTHGLGHCSSTFASDPIKTVSYSDDVRLASILAQLPLSFDPGNLELDPDDHSELRNNEIPRRIVWCPRHRTGGFVARGESANQSLGPIGVVMNNELTVNVRHHVIPGGNHPAALPLCRIPGGTDVSIRTVHNDQRIYERLRPPLAVRTRKVPVERAEWSNVRFEQEWQGRANEAVVRECDQV